MVNDSGRYSALIKFLGLCILIKNANGNILTRQDASRRWLEAYEDVLECYRIVTLDFATQNARFHMPLQNSAVGFRSSVCSGVQSPRSIFGDFFYARLAWLQMVAGQGRLRACRCLSSGLSTLFGPPPRLTAGLVGNKCNSGVQPC